MPCALATPPPSPPIPAWCRVDRHDEDTPENQIPLPPLAHTLHQEASSVLCLAADERWIFSGCQANDIYVWDRETFQVAGLLEGHTGSVLALEVAPQKKWLFSSSGDSTIRIWSTETLVPLYVLTAYSYYASGDIFSVTFSPSTETLFFGCQNTSLQWFDFSPNSKDWKCCPERGSSEAPGQGPSSTRKPHKFFDSMPQPARQLQSSRGIPSPRMTPSSSAPALPSTPPEGNLLLPQGTPPRTVSGLCPQKDARAVRTLEVPEDNWIRSAHYGYVYCLALVQEAEDDIFSPLVHKPRFGTFTPDGARTDQLVTGGGDECVKLWAYTSSVGDSPAAVSLVHTFHAGVGAILSIICRHGNIYAGCQEGHVKIWDIETKTLIRTIIAQEAVDILSVSMINAELYACFANGSIQRYSHSFECTGCWKGHEKTVLSSILVPAYGASAQEDEDKLELITGGSDNNIKMWRIKRPAKTKPRLDRDELGQSLTLKLAVNPVSNESVDIEYTDTMLYALAQFISIPSISNSPSHKEDCRQAAIWLKKCLIQFGAESQLLYGEEGKNPVVLGTFSGTESDKPKPRILFYGHYDVFAAGSSSAWDHDPFTLNGLNGYLYGRGVTDNKGPVLAVACAASEMLARRSLGVDLVLLVEGEEEAGSAGFTEAVQKYKDQIGHIDAILVSNSYWIDDMRPCVTYGLRGVVHATVEISGEGPDVHSGVDGGGHVEPMMDMVKLLGKLQDGRKISIPGFYDRIRPPSEEEDGIFNVLEKVTGKSASSFSSRWREPTLSVHSISDSGFGNSTIIPSRVRAKISLRTVPDQITDEIVKSMEAYIQSTFSDLSSPNTLNCDIDRTADWWIGSFENPWFKALEGAIYEEWGVEPLRIREGGSIPSIPFLEKEFGCSALHLPMGQSSDQAHLRNERISLNNLRKGKGVVEKFFQRVATAGL
ncbi:hypothetical protein FRB99_001739 [Tulasnella sp. 403]|nr:hypothetical protein FRB99_001739 [Tulasnella sp. 403]